MVSAECYRGTAWYDTNYGLLENHVKIMYLIPSGGIEIR